MGCRDTIYRSVTFWADDALASLRERFPKWDVWYVYCYPNNVSWSAKPAGDPIATIQRGTPDDLASAIEVAEADGSATGA